MKQTRVGNARVNFSSLIIEGDAGRYSVEPRILEVLEVLIEHHGEVVSREDLIDRVWGIGYGGDERLSRAISLLRKAFGERRGEYRYIETISKRGYRLIAPVDYKERKVGIPAPLAPPLQSIAVLPFLNMSADPEQEHFADGLTEELLNALTHVSQLKVTARTSSYAFKGTNENLRDIGATLNVAHILKGSFRRDGKKARITAQLISTEDGYHLWSESYDEVIGDTFQVQDKIANAIVSALAKIMDFASPQQLSVRPTGNEEAYDLFVQGRRLTYMI